MIDDDLIRATRKVVAERGLHDATLSAIADAAGVSRVTLHRRGVTKDLLVSALADEATEAYREALWPVLTAPGPPLDRLRAALGVVCEQAEANLDLLVWLRGEGHEHFIDEAEERTTRSVFTDPLERLLRDALADGSVRDVDPVEAAALLFMMVGWTYVHLRAGHGWTPGRAAAATIDMALNGVVAT